MKICAYLRIIPSMPSVASGNYYSSTYDPCLLALDEISESVLEASISMAREAGGSLSVFAIGSSSCERELVRAKMCGADDVFLVEHEGCPDASFEASECARLALDIKPDVFVMPAFSQELCISTIAPFVSSVTKTPFFERVTSARISDNRLHVKGDSARCSVYEADSSFPAIVSFCGRENLRYPTLKPRLQNENHEVRKIQPASAVLSASHLILSNEAVPQMNPDEAAAKIISLLQEKGVLKI